MTSPPSSVRRLPIMPCSPLLPWSSLPWPLPAGSSAAKAAQGEVTRQLQTSMSPTIAAAIEDILKYSQNHGGGMFATIISIVVLFVAALGLFEQVQDALNSAWGVQPKSGRGIWAMIRDRAWSFLMVLVMALLLLASLVCTTVVQSLEHFVHPSAIPGGIILWRLLNWGVTFVLLTALFAMIYKWLPDVHIKWRDVWVGCPDRRPVYAR